MPVQHPNILHIFGGGFATDFGPSAEVRDQGGTMVIPYLTTAEDCEFDLDGGPRKVGGLEKLHDVSLESGAKIHGLYDYFRYVAGTPIQRRVVHVGTKVKADNADGNFSDIETGLTAGAVPAYATFDNLLLFTSDASADVPRKFDGTTVSTLGSNTPNFSFMVEHVNRIFAAGVPSAPSTLFYSPLSGADNGPDGDWTADGGEILIAPDDGEEITGLASHKGILFIFKGPHRGSIHILRGSTETGPTGFSRETFAQNIGAAAHNLIVPFADDVAFVSVRGSVHSLAATDRFGSFEQASLSRGFNRRFLERRVTRNRLKFGWAVDDAQRGCVRFLFTIDGEDENNCVLCMDYRFQPPRWSFQSILAGGSMASIVDPDDAGRPRMMFGGNDGFVRKGDTPNRSIDSVTPLSFDVATPFLSYTDRRIMKTLDDISVSVQPTGAFDLDIQVQRDSEPFDTYSVDQAGGDVLASIASGVPPTQTAPEANPFVLDTSTLGGERFVERFARIERGGQFRQVQYRFLQSGIDEDAQVHAFSAKIQRDAESTEDL